MKHNPGEWWYKTVVNDIVKVDNVTMVVRCMALVKRITIANVILV